MKKLLIVLFVLSVVIYTSNGIETAYPNEDHLITTYDLPHIN